MNKLTKELVKKNEAPVKVLQLAKAILCADLLIGRFSN